MVVKPFPNLAIAFMILEMILFHGCQDTCHIPFSVDSECGTCSFTGNGNQLGPFHMDLDGTNPLEGAFLFEKEDHLTCINSKGDLDLVMLMAGEPSGGTMTTKIINTGKVAINIYSFDQLVLPVTHDETPSLIDKKRVIWRDQRDRGFLLRTGSTDDCPWDLVFTLSESQLRLSMKLNGSPVVLLPGESLKLPPLEMRLDPPDYPQ